MEQKNNKESFLFKINKQHMVVANSLSDAERVFKEHYANITIMECKRIGNVLM